MSRLIYIHNQHQTESWNALADLILDGLPIEVIDFMDIRNKYRFRTTPTVLILPDNAEITEKNTAVLLEEFTPQLIRDKQASARVITLSAPKTEVAVGEVLRITASMTDLDGNDVPIEPILFDPLGLQLTDSEGILDFSASEEGVYIIETKTPDCVQGYLEVTVNG